MKIGNLFKAATKMTTIPLAMALDVVTLGARKATDGHFYVEELIDDIKDELNDE